MAGNFPYRRDTSIKPYAFKVTGPNEPLAPTAINKQDLADKGIETFRLINPAKCWIWLRGITDAEMATATYSDVEMNGHLFPPGSVEVMKTQYPDNIVVVAANMPDLPAVGGDGMYLFPNRYAYIIYGGGF